MSLPTVLVMMATYNGQKYIAEQIDSILAQKGVDVTLIIRDDCSTDSTPSICRKYQKLFPKKISFSVNAATLMVAKNFMHMVYRAKADLYDFFAFSDQDDVWLPNKLRVAIDRICCEEPYQSPESHRFKGAVLYCSDLQDVDVGLRNGRRELAALHVNLSKRATPLIRNVFSGCTMVFNSSMLRLLQAYECNEINYPRIHDAWCAMVAYYCANLLVDFDHALILRRITGKNAVGALTPNKYVNKAFIGHLTKKSKRACVASARLLLDGYAKYMSESDRNMIKDFVEYGGNWTSRLHWALSDYYSTSSVPDELLIRLKFILCRI